MRILLVGANGMLGRSLQKTMPGDIQLVAHGHETLDVTDEKAVRSMIVSVAPDFIFNASGYTAVDLAESQETEAEAVNAKAVAFLAAAAEDVAARLVHVSTDFVFDGGMGKPYSPDAVPHPLSAYGRTKLAGEQAAGPGALIVRTAWLYGPSGHNFVRTMLDLMRKRTEIRVVSDQVGTPTYAPGLAAALWAMARKGLTGIYHYTDTGVASWFDFAVAIQEEALLAGLLPKAVSIVPISGTEFPAAANRPNFSVLDKSSTFAALGSVSPHWRENLRVMIREVGVNG